MMPKNFTDPTFFGIADRFFALSNKYGFKYTIFIIGRDLENPEVASRVKDWYQQGHEIGNHSYSHKQNLGFLKYREIEFEVMKSHDIITKVCGEEPKGFIAPAISTNLIDILLKNNYLYDTSLFPSYFMWLITIKLYWNLIKDVRRTELLYRKDKMLNLLGNRKPFFTDGKSLMRKSEDGLLIIPLPVTPYLRIPCWHTMSFFLPLWLYRYVLKSTLKQSYFYYLVHPADLIDLSDIPADFLKNGQVYERLDVDVSSKLRILDEECLATIKSHVSEIVTLKTIANSIILENRKNGIET